MKSKALEKLRELALARSRELHPTLPESARSIRAYNEKTSTGLALCIIDFLNFSGSQCERISVTGRYIDQSKTVKDTLGFTKRIGSGTWIKSSMQKGSADLAAIVNGQAIKIEIKIGRDKQSEFQKRYQFQTEQAGGLYWLCHNFDDFLNYYNKLK